MSQRVFCWTAIVLSVSPLTGAHAQPAYPEAFRMARDIATLAADKWEGRLTCTKGNDSAAAFIAARFDSLHLKPLRGAAEGKGPYSPFFDPFNTKEASGRQPVPSFCQSNNVVGIVRGTDSLVAHEYVVIGAHYDHLGRNPRSSMDPQAGNTIRNGADDNASGTAGVMELARLFALNPARRSLMFVAFSAEEWGMIGSNHFVATRLASSHIVAMVNLDMVGRLRGDSLLIDGDASAVEFRALLTDENASFPLNLGGAGSLAGRSDHVSFSANGIPAVHFTTGEHPDYHTATDDAGRINIAGLARVVDFAGRLARRLADRADVLTFVRAPVNR